jgi:uncharacterized protein YjbI with pentapeptide repeats
MSQPLWYLRHADRVVGPFPAPQLREFIASREVDLDWEISLDQVDWLTMRDSGQFDDIEHNKAASTDISKGEWRDERNKARQRWLLEQGNLDQATQRSLAQERRTRQALSEDSARTNSLVEQAQNRRAPVWAGVLALFVLAGIGAFVWWAQSSESPIKTGIQAGIHAGIGQDSTCDTPLAEAVNWERCDKRNANLQDGLARNARLKEINLEGANLARADFSYATLNAANLRNSQLQGINLTGADLTGADMSGADLTGADLRYAVLNQAFLDGVTLQGAKLGKAIWSDGHQCAEGSVGVCELTVQ